MKRAEVMGYKGNPLVGYFYENVKNPKAVVQIFHGMQEHSKRYEDFAKFLNSKGYIVFVSDLRGHGENVKDVELQGHSDGDIFEETVNDQIIISNTLKEKYKLPLYVVGHSFGSFVAQMYITRCQTADKVVLSGSAYTNNASFVMGKGVASACALTMKNKTAKIIEAMSFGSYRKKFKNGNWLSRDEEVYEKYVADPYCGHPFPYSFYKSMFTGVLKNYKEIENIKPNLPILILAGDSDPVGGYGKLVTKLYNVYRKAGLQAECKLYNGARHEILNETNKQEVYNDIVTFLEK